MKLRHLFLAAIVALGMMACNNEDVPAVVDGAEATVSVKVVPTSNGPAVRFVGDLDSDGLLAKGLAEEYAIKSTQVWIFKNGTTSLVGYGVNGSNTDEVDGIPALAINSDIYIVVNGDGLSAATTKDQLEGLHTVVPTDITNKGLLMTGKLNHTLEVGGNAIGYTQSEKTGYKILSETKAPVTRVNARVGLVDVKITPTTEQVVLFDGLSDLQVAMFNVPEKSKIFGDAGSLKEMANFKYGQQWPTTKESYVGHDDTEDKGIVYLYDALTKVPTAGKDAAYYYVSENDASEQMLLVLRAKPMLGTNEVTNLKDIYTDENGYTYFPVKVNLDGIATATGNVGNGKVYRNTQYNIYLTIKGIGNPTIDEVDKAWLDVKVEVQDWEQVDQNVTWN